MPLSPHDELSRAILLVEDDAAVAYMLADVLTSSGYEVHQAATGAAARALVERVHPDLIILDLVMPGLDGRQALRELLALRPGQPVIVLSCVADVTAKVEMAEFLESRRVLALRRVVKTPERWNRIAEIARSFGEQLPARPDSVALADKQRLPVL